MRLLLFWTMISTILLFAATGCEELDRIAQGVRDVNEAGTRFVQTPTGKAMPPDIRWILEAGGGLAAGFALIYQQWRASQMKKTTKAIVKGVEAAANPQQPVDNVKAAIAKEMRDARIFDAGNKIVDKLKVS